MIDTIKAELGKHMKNPEEFELVSMLVIPLTNEKKRALVGWRLTIPRENSRMHSNFQNSIRVNDVDRPHGFERVILEDCTGRCNAWLSWTGLCPSFGYVALYHDDNANAWDMWADARLENKLLNTLGGHSSIFVDRGRPMAILELYHNLLKQLS